MLRAGFYTLASNQSTAPGWFFAYAGPLGPQPAGAQNRPPWTESSAGVSAGPPEAAEEGDCLVGEPSEGGSGDGGGGASGARPRLEPPRALQRPEVAARPRRH